MLCDDNSTLREVAVVITADADVVVVVVVAFIICCSCPSSSCLLSICFPRNNLRKSKKPNEILKLNTLGKVAGVNILVSKTLWIVTSRRHNAVQTLCTLLILWTVLTTKIVDGGMF
jgi:hypothetical protein